MRLQNSYELSFKAPEVGETRATLWVSVQSAPHSQDRVAPRAPSPEQEMALFRLDSLLIDAHEPYVPVCGDERVARLRVVGGGVLRTFPIAFPLPLQPCQLGAIQLEDGLVATPVVQELGQGAILFRKLLATYGTVDVPPIQ